MIYEKGVLTLNCVLMDGARVGWDIIDHDMIVSEGVRLWELFFNV